MGSVNATLIKKNGEFWLQLFIDDEKVKEKKVKPDQMSEWSSRSVHAVLQEVGQ